MKKLLLVSVVAAAMFVTGCNTKNPSVDSSSESGNSGFSNRDAEGLNDLQGKVNRVYFDFDKFNIRPDMRGVIKANAVVLNSEDTKSLKVVVEGNCDEWGTDEYNYALGLKRAKAAKDALVAQGVSADRIQVKSNGESKPTCTEKSKACDAQNRRDEFKIMQ